MDRICIFTKKKFLKKRNFWSLVQKKKIQWNKMVFRMSWKEVKCIRNEKFNSILSQETIFSRIGKQNIFLISRYTLICMHFHFNLKNWSCCHIIRFSHFFFYKLNQSTQFFGFAKKSSQQNLIVLAAFLQIAYIEQWIKFSLITMQT